MPGPLRQQSRVGRRRRSIGLSWAKSAPDLALRNSGIPPMGNVPWGTHIARFYETKQDLLDANVAYFKAGLDADEDCLWGIADPISTDEAKAALRQTVPGFDRYFAAGNIEIVRGRDWFHEGTKSEVADLMESWQKKQESAVATGRQGLRIGGNPLGHEPCHWKGYAEFERSIEESLAGRQMLIMCAYAVGASRARDILEVVRHHQCTLTLRNGKWEIFQMPDLENVRSELRILNGDLDIMSRPFPLRELLTPREMIVLAQVIRGASSKEVARTLGISPRTVEFHRTNAMQKLGAKNAPDLVRLVLG